MNVGLFLGSFNPVHHGHVIVAQELIERTPLDQVWMVLSPQNPHKKSKDLASDEHRFEMLKMATQPFEKIIASDIELHLPKPSYTIQTVDHLKERCPEMVFSLIIGQDNALKFDTWKSADKLKAFFEHIYVYPRVLDEGSLEISNASDFVFLSDLPLIQISSTQIRTKRSKNRPTHHLLCEEVEAYLNTHKLFKP